MLVTVKEYAQIHGVTPEAVRSAINRGRITPAGKTGNKWMIDSKTPWTRKETIGNITESPIYNTWRMMKQRCYNPKHQEYNRYGGRGIDVCDEWRNNSRAFVAWAEKQGWKPGLQIDRKDNDKGYSPENCRIVTRKQNIKHRTKTQKEEKKKRRMAYFMAYSIPKYRNFC